MWFGACGGVVGVVRASMSCSCAQNSDLCHRQAMTTETMLLWHASRGCECAVSLQSWPRQKDWPAVATVFTLDAADARRQTALGPPKAVQAGMERWPPDGMQTDGRECKLRHN